MKELKTSIWVSVSTKERLRQLKGKHETCELRNKLRREIEEKYYRGESYDCVGYGEDCATTSNKQK